MTDFKPKDFEEVIKDAVGSALNDTLLFTKMKWVDAVIIISRQKTLMK